MAVDTIPGLVDWLCETTKSWNATDAVPEWQQKRCRELGEKINALGGFSAMQEAYYEAKAANRYATVLQAYWDGIGDWRW